MEDYGVASDEEIFNVVIIQCLNKIPKIVIEYISHQLPNFLLEKQLLSSFGWSDMEKPHACDIRK